MNENNNLFSDMLSKLQEENKGELQWEKEWQGMPEFVQNDMLPKYSVLVNFETFDDLLAFGRLLNQKITPKTQSIWYPAAEIAKAIDKRWIDAPKQEDGNGL